MSLRPQGTTVKASPPAELLFLSLLYLSLVTLQPVASSLFSAQRPFFFDSGVWVSMMALNIYSCFILCVFRRNTEREAGS